MKRRNSNTELFGVSFLDVLSCALGGVLLLLLINMDKRFQESAAAKEQANALQTRINITSRQLAKGSQQLQKAGEELQKAQQDLTKAKKAGLKVNQLEKELEKAQERFHKEGLARMKQIQKIHATLIGLKGDLKNVVFVFDTSGSMDTNRFKEHREFLKAWIRELEFERFEVIRFSDTLEAWSEIHSTGGLQQADMNNHRQSAEEFVDGFTAEGWTHSLKAFQKAFSYPDVDTVIFFSDGDPTDATGDEVRQWLNEQNQQRRRNPQQRPIIINTIGMGNYFDKEYGKFLKKVALENKGEFIGR
jgi:von Willebrand factor type A domain